MALLSLIALIVPHSANSLSSTSNTAKFGFFFSQETDRMARLIFQIDLRSTSNNTKVYIVVR